MLRVLKKKKGEMSGFFFLFFLWLIEREEKCGDDTCREKKERGKDCKGHGKGVNGRRMGNMRKRWTCERQLS